MTEMQPAQSAATPVMMDLATPCDDFDYALGCECAYPSLQIEQWQQFDRASSLES